MLLKPSIFTFVILHMFFSGFSQEGPLKSIDFRRIKLHEDIDKIQHEILQEKQNLKKPGIRESESMTWYINGIDSIQSLLESDTILSHRLKVKYLTGLMVLIKEYQDDHPLKEIRNKDGFGLISAYVKAVEADRQGSSLLEFAMVNSYEVNSAIFGKATVFFDDPLISKIKNHVYRQFADLFPEKVLATLSPYLDLPFADTLLICSATYFPSQFYDYASASRSQLGKKISNLKDSTVQLLYKMAQEKSGRMLFPFFPLLLKKELNYEYVKANISKEAKYFSMLVNARILLGKRRTTNSDSLFIEELDNMINRKATEVFIDQINARHLNSDSSRFAIVQSLSSNEIYYLILSGENTLYTSSYIGLYNRLIDKSPGKRGDSILIDVGYHHFRKFLKIAASFNKLNGFLATMPDSTAFLLVKNFTRGLEKAKDIEDAVDVADAYASIGDSTLKEQIKNQIVISLKESINSGNKQGERVYALLNSLFDSTDNLQDRLEGTYRVSNIYNIAYRDVSDISGKIVEQVYFYGDEDGKGSFENFIAGFQDKVAWKIVKKDYWVEIRSLIGKSIWIFANLPLSSPDDKEKYIKAQQLLNRYLDSLNISPKVLVHRGHSYYLKQTISQFHPDARIILVGSCGGYQLLGAMLAKSMNAHIISTKEVGTQNVNDPILLLINESLRKGANINWIDFWKTIEDHFSKSKEKIRFDNYIPPHKNLGALFIKAYSSIVEGDPKVK